MKNRKQRLMAFLLIAAMVFTANVSAFGEENSEIRDDSDIVSVYDEESPEPDGSAAICADKEEKEYYPSANTAEELNNKLISENLAYLTHMLYRNAYITLKGQNHTFLIEYIPSSIYRGMGGGSKLYDNLTIHYMENSAVSDDNIIDGISINKYVPEHWRFNENSRFTICKCLVKESKGATVDITGAGIVPVKNTTYIKKIKFKNKYEKKKLQKELDALIKPLVLKIKKEKTLKVSSNGIADDGKTEFPLVTAIYPAYGGDACFYSRYEKNPSTGHYVKKSILANLGFPSLRLDRLVFALSDSNGMKIKKMQGYCYEPYKTSSLLESFYKFQRCEGSKKDVLKPTKDKNKKRLGLASANGEKIGKDTYLFETDGNFFGYKEYTFAIENKTEF